jgi:hypothetical protein
MLFGCGRERCEVVQSRRRPGEVLCDAQKRRVLDNGSFPFPYVISVARGSKYLEK